MKKLLIGCGAVVLVVFCFVVGAAIWGGTMLNSYQQSLVKVKTAYETTNKSYPFTPPDPPIMQRGRFQQYLLVRATLAKALEKEADAFKGQEGPAKTERSPSFADMLHLVDAPQRLGSLHVKALEEQSMSINEYLWYSKVTLGTISKAANEGKNLADGLIKAYTDVIREGAMESSPGNSKAAGSQIHTPLSVYYGVPLLQQNLKLVNGAKDELVKYPQMVSIDDFLRQIRVGGPSATSPFPPGSSRAGSAGSRSQGAPLPSATPVPNR